MSSRKKKDNSKSLALTIIAILILILCFIFHSYITNKDLMIKTDENAIKENDDDEKMDVSAGGGAVSLTYSNQVVVNMKDKKVNFYLKNPSKSRQDLTLEIYMKTNNDEILVAKSDMIPTGYSIKELDLENKLLEEGNYKGYMKLYFYDENSSNKELVDSRINMDIKVNK